MTGMTDERPENLNLSICLRVEGFMYLGSLSVMICHALSNQHVSGLGSAAIKPFSHRSTGN
jgi:hypothetical protein